MDIVSLDCLCLKAIDYKDNDRLVTLYASGKGKLTAVAKGCKSPKAKLKFAASPFCFGNYQLTSGKGGLVVTGCDQYDGFFEVTRDITIFYCAGTVLEIMDKTAVDNNFDPTLFTLALTTLNNLAHRNCEPTAELKNFIAGALEALGFGKTDLSLPKYRQYFENRLGIKLNSLRELNAL